jgi:putative colanic acid biosynthesis acetyltransferase WcaF
MNDWHRPVAQPSTGQKTVAASFSLRNRLERVVWKLVWLGLAAWTPPPLYAWRRFLLCRFGATIAKGGRVYGSARIWLPANLALGDNSTLGPGVRVYNQGRVTIGRNTVISQNAYICASTHDYEDPDFPLIVRPITIGDNVWIASEAFVGPGVTVGDGAVLAARGVAVRGVEAWSVQGGNPARLIRMRGDAPD